MISQEIFSSKKGIPDKGKTRESIQVLLNQIENPKFQIKKKKREVRLWNILQGTFKKAMRKEVAASAIECEELSEKNKNSIIVVSKFRMKIYSSFLIDICEKSQ